MCTALHLINETAVFGRTLDLNYHYKECFCVIPRNFDLRLPDFAKKQYAIMGTAFIKDSYPLLYDGVNEKGLAMAGLNFVGNAVYGTDDKKLFNVPVFKFIPWVLSQCENVSQAVELISKTDITNERFSSDLENAQLHFMISDLNTSVTIEPTHDGIKITPNTVGVLTNNPPFDFHVNNLARYSNLSNAYGAENPFEKTFGIKPYTNGTAALGLPGDFSSPSRFVRAAFLKANTPPNNENQINQLFHILNSVQVPLGAVKTKDNDFVTTVYTCAYGLNNLSYHYKTYKSQNIKEHKMNSVDLNGKLPFCFPFE